MTPPGEPFGKMVPLLESVVIMFLKKDYRFESVPLLYSTHKVQAQSSMISMRVLLLLVQFCTARPFEGYCMAHVMIIAISFTW